MRRFVLIALVLVPLDPPADAQIAPTVRASIHDAPVDGIGDSFNSAVFSGLVRKGSPSLEDRAIQEFDVSAFAGATLASATLAGTVAPNNAFDVGVRGFDFVVYGGNGVADVSDYQIAGVLVGTGSYHPPGQLSFTYSFDVTGVAQALISGGATWIGLRIQCNTDPNYPNILDDTTSVLTLVAGQNPGTPFCFGDGSGAACPCANAGFAGHGCASSFFASGARLAASGNPGSTAGTDTLVLAASSMAGPGLFFVGTSQSAGGAGTSFGDGLLCVGGAIVRLGIVFPSGGAAAYPGGLTPNPIHVGAGPLFAGDVRHFQVWYRDAVPYCTAQTFNLTQGLSLTFGP